MPGNFHLDTRASRKGTDEFLHHVIKRGLFDLHVNKNDFNTGRQFVVMKEDESQGDYGDDCENGISTLTFLNFVMASISIATNLLSNTNSNSNNNNNNNNNNNKNDNNVNIGSNNNNVNSQNVVMFNPMVGRRSLRAANRTIFWSEEDDTCEDDPLLWLKQVPVKALEFYLKLESCKRIPWLDRDKCLLAQVEQERSKLIHLTDPDEAYVTEHLLKGTAQIVGVDFY